MKYLNKKFLWIAGALAYILVLFGFVSIVLAAEFHFNLNGQPVKNKSFLVKLMVDSPHQPINALAGSVVLPAANMKVKEIRNGNSLISFWVDSPAFNSNRVSFFGIIPGGYQGMGGEILTLIVEAEAEGKFKINMDQARVLQHDGLGTEAKVAITPLEVMVAREGVSETVPTDTLPPEEFIPVVASDPTTDEGKLLLIFGTQDKESGIDHYEIQESRRGATSSQGWVKAESPYELQDQSRGSFIFVKAVDRANNEVVVKIAPAQPPIAWYKIIFLIIAAIIIVIALVVIARILAKNRERRK